jgi:hypothetical protein
MPCLLHKCKVAPHIATIQLTLVFAPEPPIMGLRRRRRSGWRPLPCRWILARPALVNPGTVIVWRDACSRTRSSAWKKLPSCSASRRSIHLCAPFKFGKEPLRRDGERKAISVAMSDKGIVPCAHAAVASVQHLVRNLLRRRIRLQFVGFDQLWHPGVSALSRVELDPRFLYALPLLFHPVHQPLHGEKQAVTEIR